jgi:hypothetical protein
MANPSNVFKTYKDGTVTFFDVGGFAGSKTFGPVCMSGDLSANAGAKADPIINYCRGAITGQRRGNDPVFEISFTAPLYQFTNGSQDALTDVLDGTGNIGSTWTKANTAFEDWNFGVRFAVEGTDHSDAADHYLEWATCIATWDIAESEGDKTMITVNLKCYGGQTKGGPT